MPVRRPGVAVVWSAVAVACFVVALVVASGAGVASTPIFGLTGATIVIAAMIEIVAAVCVVLLLRGVRLVGLLASVLVAVTAGGVAAWGLQCVFGAAGLESTGTGLLLLTGAVGMIVVATQLARRAGPSPAM
ncbi:hypothetical protein AB0I53_04080 [Saccharopolyspora sp. NPDC050389]|uniref:hypothetical protein n=1 Tax=Saccharopolyspora sp. NPDC050389 TaxID=3155516 RepID=UPI00340CAA5C